MSNLYASTYTDEDVRICISRENVRRALQATRTLLAKHQIEPFPLSELVIVIEFLNDLAWPYSPHLQVYAVTAILVKCIADTYNHLRTVFGLKKVSLDDPFKDALTHLSEDVTSNNPILAGWGLLHFQYGRPEFRASQEIMGDLLHINDRTIRRYEEEAVMQLTLQLIALERAALKKYTTERTPNEIMVAWEVRRYLYRSHGPRIEAAPGLPKKVVEEDYLSIWD